MLASLLAGVLSAVLVHADGEAPTPSTPTQAGSGLALPLPGGTWCIGQPRGVRCDHVALRSPQPVPGKQGWQLTVLDRTICVGDVPGRCDIRVDPSKLANSPS